MGNNNDYHPQRGFRSNILFLLSLVALSLAVFPIVSLAGTDKATTPEEVPVFTYHTHPPFIVGPGEGLSYELADYLSARSEGRFKFVVKPMSRPRINKVIEEAQRGIVPWVNPAWFKDKQESKHMWSKGFLMEDGNAIISHMDRKIIYDGPKSLKGLIFGGVRDHVYTGIDDYVEETGRLRRVDAENHLDNFRKLRKGRINATLTPKSGAEYLIKREGLQDKLYISPKLHSSYKRRVIIINRQSDIQTFIDSVLADIHTDPSWHRIIQNYQ